MERWSVTLCWRTAPLTCCMIACTPAATTQSCKSAQHVAPYSALISSFPPLLLVICHATQAVSTSSNVCNQAQTVLVFITQTMIFLSDNFKPTHSFVSSMLARGLCLHAAALLLSSMLRHKDLSNVQVKRSCSAHTCVGRVSTVGELSSPLTAYCVLIAVLRCSAGSDKNAQITCRVCETGKYLEKVALPYVFRFLSTELAAMNIKCTLSVQS